MKNVECEKPAILILGSDGYLGWPATLEFAAAGWQVTAADACLRRRWVDEVGGACVTPIANPEERARQLPDVDWHLCDLTEPGVCGRLIETAKPDVVLHLAHQPSAVYSMIDVEHSILTHQNNLGTTERLLWAMREAGCDAHLINLATMGEWGTPNIDIPEGFFEVEYRGRTAVLPFPRQPGSRYHETKVYMSHLISNAVKWGWIRNATEIMQGPVFGIKTPEMGGSENRLTRLDVDECFGTVINRFVVQALHPEWDRGLTVYGAGGQTRGYLTLEDSMAAISLLAATPPTEGEYRIVNQWESQWSILQLAEAVRDAVAHRGLAPPDLHVENPRVEMEEHYYNPDHETLLELGWKPRCLHEGLSEFVDDVAWYAERANVDTFLPSTTWRG